IQKRGGLCYELNGFEVVLASATIWTDSFWGADRTHSIVLFYSEDKLYLVDSGTGTNLPMKPVLLDGEPVTSSVGAFRLRQDETGNGTVVAEWLSEDGWIWQYGFYPEARPLPDELNRSKKMIHEMKESPFNKALLIAKSLPDGTVSINEERMSRKWIGGNGLVEKEERIEFENNGEKLKAVKEYASEATLNKVKSYLDQSFNYLTSRDKTGKPKLDDLSTSIHFWLFSLKHRTQLICLTILLPAVFSIILS